MKVFFNKKAQSSLELAIILSILMLFTVAIFAFIQARMSSAIKERDNYLVQGIGDIISTEVNLALSVNGDYYREFNLPFSIEGKNYSIQTTGPSDIEITIEDSSQVVFLNTDVVGSFQQGKNIVKKTNDVITINS